MSRTTTIKRTTVKPRRIDERAHGMSPEAWARLRAKSNEQVLADARADPDALPVEDRKVGQLGKASRVSLARRIRWKLGLSQSEFATTFGIPLGTLRDWEQHRRLPDQAAKSYLEVIERDPESVRRARREVVA